MSEFFGPLDSEGGVPPRQQTRVAAFLTSAHGALARQFAFALPMKLESAWQTELNAQFYRESEIVSLLLRATTWVPDFALAYMAATWEAAWLPQPIEVIPDQSLALVVDLATRAHAVHASIRPAALVPVEANAHDPFVMALRRIEFRITIAEAEDVPPDGLRVNYHLVIEIEGGKRPACVAELIALHYR